MSIKIASKLRDYVVHFAEVDSFIDDLRRSSPSCCVVDENVWRLYHEGSLRSLDYRHIIVQEVNEDQKSLSGAETLLGELIQYSAKRNLTLISIGGGMVQDLTGFVAATLYRGINWAYVPTTLLAQADSCIGGKTSLNFHGLKNLIGTFYPPSEIFIYIPFLQTLSELDLFSGLGEVVKLHILAGAAPAQEAIQLLPNLLKREVNALRRAVENSLTIKCSYITEDEFDQGRRNFLNYGHCFGHAIESLSSFEIPHGQAVVLGMILANIVARKRGLLSESAERQFLEQLLLPVLKAKPSHGSFAAESLVEAMKKDKKRKGDGLALIMLKEGYQMESVQDLAPSEVEGALRELDQILGYRVSALG